MPKKRTTKKTSKRKTITRKSTSTQISKQVLKNLVELQKVHIDLAQKFDTLSKEISSLLKLFEIAAQSFARSPAVKEGEKDLEFLSKVDKLLDQNKTIAKGLTLMEGRIRERMFDRHDVEHPKIGEKRKGEILKDDNTIPKDANQSSRPLPKF